MSSWFPNYIEPQTAFYIYRPRCGGDGALVSMLYWAAIKCGVSEAPSLRSAQSQKHPTLRASKKRKCFSLITRYPNSHLYNMGSVMPVHTSTPWIDYSQSLAYNSPLLRVELTVGFLGLNRRINDEWNAFIKLFIGLYYT